MTFITNLIKSAAICMAASLLLFVLMSLFGKYADADLIELNELSINYRNYAVLGDKQRNLLIYPESPKEGIDLGMKLDLLDVIYSDSKIESLTTSSQYQGVGLDTRLGIRITQSTELGIWHHSQHVLDRKQGNIGKFPSENAIELKVFIFKRDRRLSLF